MNTVMNDEDRKRISAALERLFDCAFETNNELLAVFAKTGLGSPSAIRQVHLIRLTRQRVSSPRQTLPSF